MNDQLTHKQIARMARRVSRGLDIAQALADELPSELGTPLAEGFAQTAMEYLAGALGDLAKIKRSLHLERIRQKTSLREHLKHEAQKPRMVVHVATPLPVAPYRPETAIIAVGGKERAA